MKIVSYLLSIFGVMSSLLGFEPKSSVVEVVATFYVPHPYTPWSSPFIYMKKATGTVVSSGKIVTSSSVANGASYLSVRIAGECLEYAAKVEAISSDLSLALLEVDSSDFHKKSRPVKMAKKFDNLPTQALAFSYSLYDERYSVAQTDLFSYGLLSGQPYRQSSVIGARIHPELYSPGAAIFLDEKWIGLSVDAPDVFLSPNHHLFVSVDTVKSFLASPERNTFFISYQPLNNLALKNQQNIQEDIGILITSDYQDVLMKGDILLRIEDHPIQNDGTVFFRDKIIGLEKFVSYYMTKNSIQAEIFREGEKRFLTIDLEKEASLPIYTSPSYYVYAGLVFVSSTEDEEESVILHQVLADEINEGYHYLANSKVALINDFTITNIQDVMKAFTETEQEHHVIQLIDGSMIVLDRELAEISHPKILEKYGIQQNQSIAS